MMDGSDNFSGLNLIPPIHYTVKIYNIPNFSMKPCQPIRTMSGWQYFFQILREVLQLGIIPIGA